MRTCRITPATIIATSINISNDIVITDPDDVAVKGDGDWGDIWD